MKYGKVIEGNLVIKKGCKDDFSEVVTITGYCNIWADVKFEAPKLENIGGYCDIWADVKFEASKKLKKNNPETASYCAKFTFNNFFKLGFLFADGILAKFLSKKTNKNGTNIYKIQIVGKTKISYCIEVNGIFSHGDTIKEAKESLLYKIADRDTSKYDNYTLETVVTFEDAIKMYRCITGACEAGTRHFVENVLSKKKKKYTVQEIIEETNGQYNSDVFANFFKKKCEV